MHRVVQRADDGDLGDQVTFEHTIDALSFTK